MTFLVLSSAGPFVRGTGTIRIILVEGIMRNNSVQEDILFRIFLTWSSGGPPVQWSGTIYGILKEGIIGNIHVKLYEI